MPSDRRLGSLALPRLWICLAGLGASPGWIYAPRGHGIQAHEKAPGEDSRGLVVFLSGAGSYQDHGFQREKRRRVMMVEVGT